MKTVKNDGAGVWKAFRCISHTPRQFDEKSKGK